MSDYTLAAAGAQVVAQPGSGTGLPTLSGSFSAVLQQAVAALTPRSNRGTGGGHVHIARGLYFLDDEVTIAGWELPTGNPGSQLVLTGDGYATRFVQNTPGKNGLVVRNGANVKLADFSMYSGATARSCLYAASDGADTEASCHKSVIDNVQFESSSTQAAAVHLKNFFDLAALTMRAYSTGHHGLLIENDSGTTNYGNSHFGFLRTVGSTSQPYAGLAIRTARAPKFMNMLTFANFESVGGYYGLRADGLRYSSFAFVDIEGVPRPIHLDGDASGSETRHVTVAGGYLQPTSGGVAVTQTLYTGGNSVTAVVAADAATTPIDDRSLYRPVNSYDVSLYDRGAEARIATANSNTQLTVRRVDGTVIRRP